MNLLTALIRRAHAAPVGIVTTGVVLTLGCMALIGWHAWNVFDRFRSIEDTEVRFQRLSGDITYLDEALTMSARMTVLTGDPQWKARYQRLEPRLEAVIRETVELVAVVDAQGMAAAIDEANRRLTEMESRAFALLEQGRRQAAATLLLGDDYEGQKRNYADAARLTVGAIHARVQAQFSEARRQLVVAVAVWMVCLAMLTLAWITIVSLMRRHHAARDRAETALVAARRQSLLILDSVGEGIHGVDGEGRILFGNRAAATMLGYDEHELIGKPVHTLIHHHRADGRDYPAEECPISRTLRDGEVRQVDDEVFFRKDGGSFPVEYVCSPIRDQSGAITGVVVSFRDVTARKRAEEALRASEARLRAVVESEPECVKVVSMDGRLLDMNPAGLRMVEATDREAVLGRPVVDLVHPEDRTTYMDLHRWASQGGTGQLQFRLIGLKGTERWMETHATPLRDADGTVTSVLNITRDITERKRAETCRQESEVRFRQLAENIEEVFWLTDPEKHEMLYISPSYESIWGRSCRDLYQNPRQWIEAIHPADRPRIREALARQLRGDYSEEYRVVRPDGTVRWIADRAFPVRDRSGRVYRIAGVAQDITERKRVEQRLQESEERFRLLAKATNDAIWDWNLVTNELWWNEGFEALFGYRRDEVEPTIESWTKRIHPDDYDRVVPDIHRVIDGGGEHWSGEYRFLRKDGAYAYVLDRGHVIRDPSGKAVRMVGGMTDLTERKHLEAQLLQSQKMEAIGRLAGGVAHDFNNLLTVINGYCELLRDDRGLDAGRRHVEQIALAAERAAALTSQLLAFSRRQVVQLNVLDLNAVLERVRKLLTPLIGEHIELVTITEPALGRIKADASQMEQVIMNLAVNARDAMPQGGTLTIRTANVEMDRPAVHALFRVPAGSYVMLAMTDTGIGMDAETRARIFEPFFTTKPQGEGTGLGLSTVYGIVKQSDGYILADSQPGRGTTFTILLPRAAEAVAAPGLSEPEYRPVDGWETLLLVEDEEMIRDLARHILESHGYTVLTAASGKAAVDLAERHAGPIHLLITDVVMPGMSGRELADRLARPRARLRVLYMSGYTFNEIGRHGVLTSDIAFIQKPFSPDGLVRKVRDVLNATHSAGCASPPCPREPAL